MERLEPVLHKNPFLFFMPQNQAPNGFVLAMTREKAREALRRKALINLPDPAKDGVWLPYLLSLEKVTFRKIESLPEIQEDEVEAASLEAKGLRDGSRAPKDSWRLLLTQEDGPEAHLNPLDWHQEEVGQESK